MRNLIELIMALPNGTPWFNVTLRALDADRSNNHIHQVSGRSIYVGESKEEVWCCAYIVMRKARHARSAETKMAIARAALFGSLQQEY